jgi:hypothetical protein
MSEQERAREQERKDESLCKDFCPGFHLSCYEARSPLRGDCKHGFLAYDYDFGYNRFCCGIPERKSTCFEPMPLPSEVEKIISSGEPEISLSPGEGELIDLLHKIRLVAEFMSKINPMTEKHRVFRELYNKLSDMINRKLKGLKESEL